MAKNTTTPTFPSLQQLDPLHEVLFATNLGRDSAKETVFAAFSAALAEANDAKRTHMMGMLLTSIMAKGPTTDEVCGLLDAAFAMDQFDPMKRPAFPSEKKTITIAGSGKKGFKTVNISSLAAIVAACHGDLTVLKLCSPSTSSVTGSQDFFSLLGGNVALSLDELVATTQQTNIGFFPVEDVLPTFAATYTGWYYAPHAMSFALAGMTCRYKTDYLFYGLAHPNVTLSTDVFQSYGYAQAMVATSTYDGTHYIDEVLGQCGVSIQGYQGKSALNPHRASLYVEDELGISHTSSVHQTIRQAGTQEENIIKGLSAFTGNVDLATQVAINAAIYLVASELYSDLKAAFHACMATIASGAPVNKLHELVTASGGTTHTLDQLLDTATSYAKSSK